MDLSDQRTSYEAEGIDPDDLATDPFAQFASWFEHAQASAEPEPYAFVLATTDESGWPLSRTVLLRSLDEEGFVFYTNYTSAKGRALETTKKAGMTFLWHGPHRQIHVSGTVDRINESESDAYFSKRPRDSQLGAWASQQSSVIAGRHVLQARLAEAVERFGDGPISRPEFWGGYRIRPRWIEFWQGQPNRLHDRVRYVRNESGDWDKRILSP